MARFAPGSTVAERGEGKSDLKKSKIENGGLAQLARAPALHAGGQRFESVILHIIRSSLA